MIRKLLTALAFATSLTSASMAQDRPPLPTSYDALLEMATNHVEALHSGHEVAWRFSQHDSFDVDLRAATITFFMSDGSVARAPAQLLGTWNPTDNTFLWGWDHPSAPAGTPTASAALRDHARAAGIPQLSGGLTNCTFDDCYPIAATAVLVGDLQGIYRFDAGGPWAYIGFGNVTLSEE